MSYLLGIDVGTTRTAAAICRQGARPGEAEIINLGDRSSAVPSVLFVGNDGSVLVGDAAERRAVSNPDAVVREFKRRIGDPTPLVVGGRPWAPEELSARLVRWVIDQVARREGGPAARVAVTHPASWGAHKKDRMGGALAALGLPVSFLAEPQAAALHYAAGERVEAGSTIAVYDLGGGTFDAAMVHKDASGGFSLLGRPEGLERLGGIDFDEVVFEHVRQGLPDAFDNLDETDLEVLSAIAAVRRECVEAKEALSSDTEVSIPVPGHGAVRLHRSEFEAMIRPSVEDTVDALRKAVQSAGLTPDRLTAVLLVGGSSRIPLVSQLVSEQLGRPVAVDTDPKNAIALGAALSLTPNVGSATGAASRVPGPRGPGGPGGPGGRPPAPARSGSYAGAGMGGAPEGATEVVRKPVGGAPMPAAARYDDQYETQSYGGARGYGAAGAMAAAGPPMQRVAASGSMAVQAAAPPRPMVYPDRPIVSPEDVEFDRRYDYEYDDRARRRPAVLVSIGGAVAAVAVIGAALLWDPTDPVAADPASVGNNPVADAPAVITTTTSEAPATSTTDEEETEEPPVRVTTAPRTTTQAPVTTAPPVTTEPPVTTVPVTTVPVTTVPPVTDPVVPPGGGGGGPTNPAAAPAPPGGGTGPVTP